MEERLREAAAVGDELQVMEILKTADLPFVNSRNLVNGWTALHWACKRGHLSIVSRLLMHGADPGMRNNEGETAAELTTLNDIRALLGASSVDVKQEVVKQGLPIVPNYLANPVFPYRPTSSAPEPLRERWKALKDSYKNTETSPPSTSDPSSDDAHISAVTPGVGVNAGLGDPREIILRVRVADSLEQDFIEIEVPQGPTFNFESLLSLVCLELDVERTSVKKLRKLPNTIVRRDRDVTRLKDSQELEVVLK